jgi:hypothetical protein
MSKPKLIRTTGEFPPGGYPFQDPITGKGYRDMETGFDQRVAQIVNDRLANRRLIKRERSVTPSDVAFELSEYVCTQLRANPRYCTGGDLPPPSFPGGLAAIVPDRKCPHCGAENSLRSVVCVPCGNKHIAYRCNQCGKETK